MKALSIFRLCVVAGMMFGLFAAWSAAVPQQLSTSQGAGTSYEAVRGGECQGTGTCYEAFFSCSDTVYGGDPSCTGFHRPFCHALPGEGTWTCPIQGYYCDGPSPTCDLPMHRCQQE